MHMQIACGGTERAASPSREKNLPALNVSRGSGVQCGCARTRTSPNFLLWSSGRKGTPQTPYPRKKGVILALFDIEHSRDQHRKISYFRHIKLKTQISFQFQHNKISFFRLFQGSWFPRFVRRSCFSFFE